MDVVFMRSLVLEDLWDVVRRGADVHIEMWIWMQTCRAFAGGPML